MWYLLAFLIFIIIVGSTWWMGLWNNLITLTNFFIAALVASSFYQNVFNTIVGQDRSYVAVASFLSVWALFALTFFILRFITDLGSAYRLKFDKITELVGRSVLSVWLGGAFVCFTFFTLQLAPLPPHLFEGGSRGDANSVRNIGIGPERLWLAFVQSRSRGALAESRETSLFPTYPPEASHPDDPADARVFDPRADFIDSGYWLRCGVSQRKTLRQ